MNGDRVEFTGGKPIVAHRTQCLVVHDLVDGLKGINYMEFIHRTQCLMAYDLVDGREMNNCMEFIHPTQCLMAHDLADGREKKLWKQLRI